MQLCKYLRDNIDICLGIANRSFPYWRDRPVTLKVMKHALCEHDKFIRLDDGKGLRKCKSVSHLDAIKPCQCCGEILGFPAVKGSTRCDSCHAMFYSDCVYYENNNNNNNNDLGVYREHQLQAFNYCRRCYDLDNLEFD